LYQVNLTIPAAAVAGDNVVDISGPDADASQALISVGTGTVTTSSVSVPNLALTMGRGPGRALKR
jgi:hypothetical protein